MLLGLNSVMASVLPRLRSKALTMASRVLLSWPPAPSRLPSLLLIPLLSSSHTDLLAVPPSPLLLQGLCIGFSLCMDVLYPNIHQANAFSSFRPLLKCYLIRQVFPEHYTARLCIVDKTVPSILPTPLHFHPLQLPPSDMFYIYLFSLFFP